MSDVASLVCSKISKYYQKQRNLQNFETDVTYCKDEFFMVATGPKSLKKRMFMYAIILNLCVNFIYLRQFFNTKKLNLYIGEKS